MSVVLDYHSKAGPAIASSPKITAELALAYHSTDYIAAAPDGRITIRIGSTSTRLDELLRKHQAHEWAYLCAANPGSQKLSLSENTRRFAELVVVFGKRAKTFFKGYSRAEDASWPDEEGALALGISLAEALEIGRSFGQLAIVNGVLGGQAVLTDCQSGKPV